MLLCSLSVVSFTCDSCAVQTLQPCRLARGLGPPVVRRERDENTQEEQDVHVHVVGVVSATGHTTRKLIFKVCSRDPSSTCRCSASAIFLRPWAYMPRISCLRACRGCGPRRTCEVLHSSLPPFSSTCSRPCAYLSWRPCVT